MYEELRQQPQKYGMLKWQYWHQGKESNWFPGTHKCKFQTRSVKGHIEATLVKDCDYFSCGHLRFTYGSELTLFGSTHDIIEYFNKFLLQNYLFRSKEDCDLKREATAKGTDVTDPFYCLRETISVI